MQLPLLISPSSSTNCPATSTLCLYRGFMISSPPDPMSMAVYKLPGPKTYQEAMNPQLKYRLHDVMKDAVFRVKSNEGPPHNDGRPSVPLCAEQCAIR